MQVDRKQVWRFIAQTQDIAFAHLLRRQKAYILCRITRPGLAID